MNIYDPIMEFSAELVDQIDNEQLKNDVLKLGKKLELSVLCTARNGRLTVMAGNIGPDIPDSNIKILFNEIFIDDRIKNLIILE